MLVDAESLSGGSTVDADVTVVGAGPAGIVIALELGKAGFSVALVESGRLRLSGPTQKLGDTDHYDPRRHAPISQSTPRQFGLPSIIFRGICLPSAPVDFAASSHIPYSSSPIRYEDLEGYFQRASDYLSCGVAEFNIGSVPGVDQVSIVPGLPDGDILTSTIERWSLPTNFGKEYGAALKRSERIRLIQGLTCTEIECDESGSRVAAIRGRTLGGNAIRLRASKYVLACGGLETTRLLLASDCKHPGGIGNHSGHLGRFYMGHISGQIAQVRFATDPRRTVYAFDRGPDGVYLRRRFSFTREFQHRKKLTNIVSWLVNPRIADPTHGSGILSFAFLALSSLALGKHLASEAIRKSAIAGGLDGPKWPHIRNILRDFHQTLAFIPTFGYKRYLASRKAPGFYHFSESNTYRLHYHGEQVPNPDSTVTLVQDTDELGMRKVKIDLRYSALDVSSVVRAHQFWDRHLRGHGCGHLEYLTEDLESSVWEQATDGFHQVGTTRMSADPANGVVGLNCNVSGFEDLFVASSSIFVTSGQANSTFMMLVFGLRLADYLTQVLRVNRLQTESGH